MSSRHWSGCRTRWSASALLAPSTESSRIEVPSSSAASASSASRSGDASASRSSPARARSGSAARPSSGSNGSACPPSWSSSDSARSVSANPARTSRERMPARFTEDTLARGRPGEVGETLRQRTPRPVQLVAGGLDLAQQRLLVDAPLEVVVAVARGPRREDRDVHLRVQLDPQARGPKRATWSSPSAVSARATAPAGSVTTTSLFHCTPRLVPRPPTSSSSAAASSQPTSNRPTCCPRASGCTSPPRAAANSWWPRQMPSVGSSSVTASRSSWRTGASHGASASSRAPTEPPSTSSPSYAPSGGSSSPAQGRQTTRSTPASVNQVPRWAAGHCASCSIARMRVTVVARPQMTGSIRSRS